MTWLGIIGKKERKRRTLRKNQRRGRASEIQGSTSDAILGGWSSKRTGKGSDYKQTRTSVLTGKKQTRYVDYKTGNAKLSNLQKKKKAKKRIFNPIPPF